MNKTDIIGGDNLGGATRKMTTQDKLSIIVQAGIDGKWEPIKSNPRILQIDKKLGTLIEYDYENYARKDARIQQAYIAISLPDFISNRAFMLAVYGEKKIETSSDWRFTFANPAYMHHAIHATKLLLTSTPDAAIEYLYKEMKNKN